MRVAVTETIDSYVVIARGLDLLNTKIDITFSSVGIWSYSMVASSLVWVALTAIGNISDAVSSPILRSDGFGMYAFSIAAICVGLIPSVYVLLHLFIEMFRSRTEGSIQIRILRISGFLSSAIGLMTPLFVLERALPVSVVPFSTLTCATVFFTIAWFRTRAVRIAPRSISLSAGVLLILSMQYLDWNPRKPFLRTIYHLRTGMTMNEVSKIMHGYLNRANPGDPEPEIQINDRIIYRPSNDPAYNADWGIVTIRDGKVQAIEFSAD